MSDAREQPATPKTADSTPSVRARASFESHREMAPSVHEHCEHCDPGSHSDTSVKSQERGSPPAGLYTCPMHPEIREENPGTCPKCGMALEPRTAVAEGEEESSELTDMRAGDFGRACSSAFPYSCWQWGTLYRGSRSNTWAVMQP
ncbi:MAG: heavy metal-binding domain-containing protein [Desulfomonilaceae bacterium]